MLCNSNVLAEDLKSYPRFLMWRESNCPGKISITLRDPDLSFRTPPETMEIPPFERWLTGCPKVPRRFYVVTWASNEETSELVVFFYLIFLLFSLIFSSKLLWFVGELHLIPLPAPGSILGFPARS